MAERWPTSFSVAVPPWLQAELGKVPETLPDDEAKMALVNALAERNYAEQTGGPFAALVVESATGRIVSVGVNLVLSSGLSSAHAEVVAISLAQTERDAGISPRPGAHPWSWSSTGGPARCATGPCCGPGCAGSCLPGTVPSSSS